MHLSNKISSSFNLLQQNINLCTLIFLGGAEGGSCSVVYRKAGEGLERPTLFSASTWNTYFVAGSRPSSFTCNWFPSTTTSLADLAILIHYLWIF